MNRVRTWLQFAAILPQLLADLFARMERLELMHAERVFTIAVADGESVEQAWEEYRHHPRARPAGDQVTARVVADIDGNLLRVFE